MALHWQARNYRPALEKAVGFSQAVVSGPYLMLSGLCSCDENAKCIGKGDMVAQVRNIYTEIANILRDHGLTYAHVVRETVYTTDLDALAAAAPERLKFFTETDVVPPAATWIQVSRLFNPDFLLEVEITAEMPAVRG
jgi:2-iminobutanoate/2-iminopropanoate deaminase